MTEAEVRQRLSTYTEGFAALGVPTLKDRGYYYGSLWDFLLQEGVNFTDVKKAPRLMAPKMCFRNATSLTWDDPDLTYVEGVYIDPHSGFLPVHHAWVVTKDGTVIEPTLRWRPPKGRDRTGHGYFGVPFTTEFMTSRMVENKVYGLLDDWNFGYEMFRQKLDPKFVAQDIVSLVTA